MPHCPVTGRSLLDCDCGACEDLESGDSGEDGPEAA